MPLVPVLVRRHPMAAEALGFEPPATATGAPTARIESIPDIEAEAVPTIFGLWLPRALGATDARWAVASAIVGLA